MNTTKKIIINDQEFHARSLRRQERRKYNLHKYGYGPFHYRPPQTTDGGIDWELSEAGQELALKAIFGDDGFEAIDQCGGEVGLREAWMAIIAVTYGSEGQEKNSRKSGDGSQTQTESDTASNA